MVFGKVANKTNLCVIEVSDASNYKESNCVAQEILMVRSKTQKTVLPIFWKSGVIRKIYPSP